MGENSVLLLALRITMHRIMSTMLADIPAVDILVMKTRYETYC